MINIRVCEEGFDTCTDDGMVISRHKDYVGALRVAWQVDISTACIAIEEAYPRLPELVTNVAKYWALQAQKKDTFERIDVAVSVSNMRFMECVLTNTFNQEEKDAYSDVLKYIRNFIDNYSIK
ncbi:MAG: hypothetical protein EBX41_00875 [Chitinophagia bacterium]|nr:hypothetical protein [Chitinophagia bacterium]